MVPWGLRKNLEWLKKSYGSPEIYITENGFSDYPTTGLNDTRRANYYNLYINEMLKAVEIGRVNVLGYTAWYDALF